MVYDQTFVLPRSRTGYQHHALGSAAALDREREVVRQASK